MNNEPRAFSAESVESLSAIVLHTRSTPAAFQRGAAWLAESFTHDAIATRLEAAARRELADAEKNGATGSRYVEMVRASAAETLRSDSTIRVAGAGYLPQRTMAEWLVNRDTTVFGAHLWQRMSRIHAEAVLLVVAFFWDRADDPNPALPAFMRATPYGTPEAVARPESLAGNMLNSRWLWFHPINADAERVMEAVRCAPARLLMETR